MVILAAFGPLVACFVISALAAPLVKPTWEELAACA